jgi:hypothetical protein
MNAIHEVFLVVDPVQDYEESLTIWGAFGSLDAAKYATTGLRRKHLDDWEKGWRDTEIQHWRGRDLRDVWTFDPKKSRWSHTPRSGS